MCVASFKNKHAWFLAIALCAVLLLPAVPRAAPADGISSAIKKTGLPVPRWVSLRSSKINMRVGPSKNYPVSWVFTRKNLPVEIVAEFDVWRKVRDPSGMEGWMHQATLSSKRSFMVVGKTLQPLYRKPNALAEGALRAQLEPNVQGKILKCEGDWCRVEVSDGRTTLKGYMQKTSLWGVYAHENF